MVELYGQWLTYQGKLRKVRARQQFEQLTESFFNPATRIGRIIARMYGKKSCAPQYFGEADSFDGDYVIRPIDDGEFPWEPTVILAVCFNEAS
jgi:hypothetical protein